VRKWFFREVRKETHLEESPACPATTYSVRDGEDPPRATHLLHQVQQRARLAFLRGHLSQAEQVVHGSREETMQAGLALTITGDLPELEIAPQDIRDSRRMAHFIRSLPGCAVDVCRG
jgi:hypothetical protein